MWSKSPSFLKFVGLKKMFPDSSEYSFEFSGALRLFRKEIVFRYFFQKLNFSDASGFIGAVYLIVFNNNFVSHFQNTHLWSCGIDDSFL